MSTATDSVDLVGDDVVGNLVRAALLAALMGAFAFVSFPNPLNPAVPVTAQVLGVFLAGIYLGPAWGGFAMALYVLAGVLGAPVFSGASAGLGQLFGPTGGYLLSYPFAAALIGALIHGTDGLADPESVSLPRLVAAMAAGTVVIYGFGIPVYWYYLDTNLVAAVVGAGLAFVPAELVKMAAAVGIVRSEEVQAT
ncbi:biotin transporter BioY [Halolamina salifodinae]|uniref:Biotin transport system substrate-specific component n=1 Tax=Halolamina salifodinae TaxID=1202767 RepID=A0A8T4H2S7_9EURY|nr:biotin transporter BioY [Halolamina salifodinae]MBP1987935.1 biotin transport system substrate-specific component [Halolamina salifodinae]